MSIMHFNKQVPRFQALKTEKKWHRFVANEVKGLKVGFLGFGDIGKRS